MTIGNAISGSGTVTQTVGTVTVTGSNTYSEGTTIGAGRTLRIGDGGTTGTLSSGHVTVNDGGLLVFDRSDSITVANAISGQGDLAQAGSGTLTLTGDSSVGAVTISGGTLQVEGTVTTAEALSNQGTLRVVGTGVLEHAGTRIAGNAAAVSAGEVFLISTGLGSASTTFDFEISTDGVNYYPLATGGETTEKAKNNDEIFRDAAKNNCCPEEIIDLILDIAKQVKIPKPGFGSKFVTHNYCEQWVDTFMSNLRNALNQKGLKNGLKDASQGCIAGPLEKTIWFVPGKFPIFAPPQDHTTATITFKDGTVFYIDCTTLSSLNINNLWGGPSHIGLPSQIPSDWEQYPRKPQKKCPPPCGPGPYIGPFNPY